MMRLFFEQIVEYFYLLILDPQIKAALRCFQKLKSCKKKYINDVQVAVTL
jgi:hypothetical protein